MTNTNTKNAVLEQLRRHAVNDITRQVARDGLTLTHDEADDLGEEVIEWARRRLDVAIETDNEGVRLVPVADEPGEGL